MRCFFVFSFTDCVKADQSTKPVASPQTGNSQQTEGSNNTNQTSQSAIKKKPTGPKANNTNKDYETDRYIIKYKSEDSLKRIKADMKDKIKSSKEDKSKYSSVIVTNGKTKLSDLKNEIKSKNLDSDIEYIQPDFGVTLSSNDTYFSDQWGIYNDSTITAKDDANKDQQIRIDSNVVDAWKYSQGQDVTVAVLDTGIDITHEDLKDNIFTNTAEIVGNGKDDDGNGFVDDVNGWNFIDRNNVVHDPANVNDEIHGTHVAGIIGAEANNNKGITGMAPKVKILPIKVFSNGTAYTSDIIDAINYASKMGAKIVNCSWGTSEYNQALGDAIAESNMLFVCAAGNGQSDIDVNPIYPTSFDCDNIISVASLNADGNLSSFSNYGEVSVDVAAPGDNILSTTPGNQYKRSSGTSMSAAFVTGEAALLSSQNQKLVANEIKGKIINSSDRLSSLLQKVSNASKINALNALKGVDTSQNSVIKLPKLKDKSDFATPQNTTDGYNLFSTSGTWGAIANLPGNIAVSGSAAVNGKIYVVGADANVDYTTNYIYEYDPAGNVWTNKMKLTIKGTNFGVTTFNNKIYIIGGQGLSANSLAVEVYDPSINNLLQKADMPGVQTDFGIAELNGIIFTFGGYISNADMNKSMAGTNQVLAYNVKTDSWTTKASMPTPRFGLRAAAINGKVYAIGGYSLGGKNTVEAYDPSTNTWSSKAGLITGRDFFGCTVVNGKIFVLGGDTDLTSGTALKSVEEYDSATNSWSNDTDMSTTRRYPVAAGLNNIVYAIGGNATSGPMISCEKFTTFTSNDDFGNYSYNAATIQPNSITYGAINYVVGTGHGPDVDMFQVVPATSGYYTIKTTGTTDTIGVLYDTPSHQIASNDDSNDTNFCIHAWLGAGTTYYIQVTAYSQYATGAYALYMFNDDIGDSFISQCSQYIYTGTQYQQTIDYAGDEDYYAFTPSVTGGYSIFSTGNTDTYGYLYNSNRYLYYSNDDGNDNNFYIFATLTANQTYYIRVRDYSEIGTGSYGLIIQPDDKTNSFVNVTGYDNNVEVPGNIDYGGDSDVVWFQPKYTGVYNILTRGTTDTYGYLYDENYNQLACNNDSYGSTNFCISYLMYAYRTYFVRVRHYSSSGTGPYVLCFSNANPGLKGNQSYHSQEVGRAGTGYTNDYFGNVVFVHNDMTLTGNRLPAEIKHVFNSGSRYTDSGYGIGWRLNLNQKVGGPITYPNNSGQYYSYTDETGAVQLMKYDSSTGLYTSSESPGTSLKVNSDNTVTITDKGGNKLNFNTTGNLRSIQDNNGNTETINYSGTAISSITDGAGRLTTLTTDSSGRLTAITDPSSRKTSFGYSGSQLTSITYPDGKQTIYAYDSNNNMVSATNYDGYKVVYTYSTTLPYKVTKESETHTDGTLGKELNIAYGFNTSTFTDGQGRQSVYQFDNNLNTTNIKGGDGSVQFNKYDSNNQLVSSSKIDRIVVNYLKNHNMEASSDWTYTGGTYAASGSGIFSGDDKYMGYQSQKITETNSQNDRSLSQTVTLTKGKKYTLSGYIKTSNVVQTNPNSGGASFLVSYSDQNGVIQYARSNFAAGSNGWQRYEVSFTLPSNSTSNNVNIVTDLLNATGTAYFDCLQLEDGSVANPYNLVENSDLTYSSTVSDGSSVPTYWNKSSGCDYYDSVSTITDTQHPAVLSPSVFSIYGTSNTAINKYLSQNIKVSGKAGDTLVLGGWAKLNASLNLLYPSSIYGSFSLQLGINGTDSSYAVKEIPFSSSINDWQFVSDSIAMPIDYSSVDVKLMYNNYYGSSGNSAWFDGIQLYKQDFGTDYTYDSNGNVTSTTDQMNQSTQTQYTNNNPTTIVDANKNPTADSYDTNHNLLTQTSAENVVSSFTYDSYGNQLTSKVGDDSLFVKTSKVYTASGNYLYSGTDSLGNITSYNYDEAKGVLNSETDGKGQTTSYSYDVMNELTGVSKSVNGSAIADSYGYNNDRLSTITHNGFTYNFGYDSMGDNTSISVGNQNLITNTYDTRSGRLTSSTYGNGQSVSQSYDNSDRVIKKQNNATDIASYEYDAGGNLGYRNDISNNVGYRYIYDSANRLTKITDSTGNTTSFTLDPNGNSKGISETIGGKNFATSYVFNKDNKLTGINYSRNSNNSVSLTYDKIGRLSSSAINTGSATYNTAFSYTAGVNGSSSNLISSISNNGNGIGYTYDKNGNIDTITQNGKVIKYYYNELNELVREDNQILNKTITYSYDAGGNLTVKTEYIYTTGTPASVTRTYSYGYGDTNWKDKLTSYDGKAITYDAIGNPLTYNGWTYTWQAGRQLQSMNGNGYNISYKYDDNGIRTQKTVNGVTTNYRLVDGRVTYESTSTGDKIYYTYDDSNNLVSMNYNGTEYYYIKNAQGDIIGLFDSTGTQVVSYTYDSWGKLVSIDGSLKDTVGARNPYRYRGYRYDTETGLYYLQSRYYDPGMGRFINADDTDVLKATQGLLLAANLFAYCGNNPTNNSDPNGLLWGMSWSGAKVFVYGVLVFLVGTYLKSLGKYVYTNSVLKVLVEYTIETVGGWISAAIDGFIFCIYTWPWASLIIGVAIVGAIYYFGHYRFHFW